MNITPSLGTQENCGQNINEGSEKKKLKIRGGMLPRGEKNIIGLAAALWSPAGCWLGL